MTRTAHLASRVVTWLATLFIAFVVLAPTNALARAVAALSGHVNDTAGLAHARGRAEARAKARCLRASIAASVRALTIESLEGDALEDFSIRTVEAWKLGKKGKDDGLLVLIVKASTNCGFEVGYGLEGDVTDAFSAQVMRNVLTPALRAGKADQGVEQAFDVLTQKASGAVVPDSAVAPPPSATGGPSPFAIFGLLFFLLPFLLPLLFARGRSGFRVGGLGGFGGGYGGGWSGGGRSGGWAVRWFRWWWWRRRRLLRSVAAALAAEALPAHGELVLVRGRRTRGSTAAVARVEAQTAAEVVVAVVPQSREYWQGRALFAVAWALAAGLAFLHFEPWQEPALALLLELAVGATVCLLCGLPSVLRLLVPATAADQATHDRAFQLFAEAGPLSHARTHGALDLHLGARAPRRVVGR